MRTVLPGFLRATLGVACGLVLLGSSAYADAVVTQRSLGLDAAREAATAAIEACRRDGLHVTVTVVNAAGQTLVVLRDDGTAPHTVENSLRKAYTALTFRATSGAFGKRITADPANIGVLNLEHVTSLEGALPIVSHKDVVGAIGASGAPNGALDAACVQIGIDRIARALEAP